MQSSFLFCVCREIKALEESEENHHVSKKKTVVHLLLVNINTLGPNPSLQPCCLQYDHEQHREDLMKLGK